MSEAKWSGGDYINLGPSGAIAAANYAAERFQQLGVHLPPGNRLSRARQLLEEVNKRAVELREDDEQTLRAVAEAQWTILDFYLIARATGKHVTEEHLAKVTLALGGTDRPEHDKNHLPRNTTFELVTAATLTMGNLPVMLGEPDLLAVLNGEVLGVAAKRVQGAKAIRRRMLEAADQIERSELRGIVAINADVIMIGTEPVGDASEKGETVDEKLAEVHRADDALILVPHVIGRIAFGRTAQWSFEGDRPALTQDMFRQYRVFDRGDVAADDFIAELEGAEAMIRQRMQNL